MVILNKPEVNLKFLELTVRLVEEEVLRTTLSINTAHSVL